VSFFDSPRRTPADRASIDDRVFFERHPGATSYIRPYVPGEFGLSFPPPDLTALSGEIQVEVEQLARDLRRRRPAFVAITTPVEVN
jgi:hypothetical protein